MTYTIKATVPDDNLREYEMTRKVSKQLEIYSTETLIMELILRCEHKISDTESKILSII